MPDPTERPDQDPQPPAGPSDAETRPFEPAPAGDATRPWTPAPPPGQGPYQPQPPYQQPPYGQGPYQQPPYGQGPYQPQPQYQQPQYPPPWPHQPPGAFPPLGSLPPRRRGPGAVVGVLVLLLAVTTIIGGTAWYLLLRGENPGASASPTTVAAGSPTLRPTVGPTIQPTQAATPPPSPTSAPSPSVAPPSVAPVESPQPSPSTGASATPLGSQAPASIDPQIVAQIDAIVAQVPLIRGLEPKREVPYRFITREQFAEQFRQQFDEDNPPEVLAAEEALEKRLGLLALDADLRQLAESLYTSQVLAFYDPEIEEFTVITRPGNAFTPSDRVTVAHEYDHALQDQYWDLEKLHVTDPTQGDRSLAHTSLAEGDATALMYGWAFLNLTQEELLALGSSVTPEDQQLLDSMPLILKRTLIFPYLGGLNFVSSELQAGGSWDAVDAIWDNPPSSTEQVIHPEKYAAGEQPVEIEMPDVADALGSAWSTSSTQTMGELMTDIWLADGVDPGNDFLGLPAPLPNANAAAGWGGDRLLSLDGPNGTWAIVWQTDWDTPQDAAEFSSTATAVMADLPGANSVLETSVDGILEAPVLVVIASDAATLNEVEVAVGIGG